MRLGTGKKHRNEVKANRYRPFFHGMRVVDVTDEQLAAAVSPEIFDIIMRSRDEPDGDTLRVTSITYNTGRQGKRKRTVVID